MRLTKHQGSSKVMMNITPLIDIVFLLIIFFVTVSQITEVNEEKLNLPQLTGEEEQMPTKIIININEAGEILISGRERSIADTLSIVGTELAKVNNEPAMLRITVRCDKNANAQTYNELLRQLKTLNITHIAFSVQSN